MKREGRLREARNALNQPIVQACTRGPRTIATQGHLEAVLVSAEEYRRLTQCPVSLVEVFRHSPLYGLDIDVERRLDLGHSGHI